MEEAVRVNRRTASKARTRQNALDKATELFASKPYHEVLTRDIAKAMDMSTGAIYANFGSKGELFAAAVVDVMSAQLERMQQTVDKGGGLQHVLYEAFAALYESEAGQLELLCSRFSVLWAWVFAEDPDLQDARVKIRDMEDRMLRIVWQLFENAKADSNRAVEFWDFHQGNCRRLAEEAGLENVLSALRRQIRLLVPAE